MINEKLRLNLWKNTSAVTDWFTGAQEKERCIFVSFGIVDFYPSITEELLRKALNFASRFTEISKNDMDTILQARKSMLFGPGKEWVKKGDQLFDVSMGYGGAEVCKLVGAFVLDKLSEKFRKGDLCLFRDDGLQYLAH